MITRKLFWYSGIAAILVYVFATILGGLYYPHYSHTSQAISELVGINAPTRTILNPIYVFYNLLLITFAYGIYSEWRDRQTKIGAFLLFVLAVASILMWWFPMDPKDGSLSQTGVIHIMLAAVEALSTVLASLLFGFGLRKRMPFLSAVSYSVGLMILLIGPVAGGSAARHHLYMGLFERVTIGLFLGWVAAFSIIMLKRK